MTTTAEDDSTENGNSTNSPTGQPGKDSSGGSATGANLHGPHPPVTDEEWHRLRTPFSRNAYVVDPRAVGRTEENLPVGNDAQKELPQPGSLNRAVGDLRLRPETIRDRLDLVLGPQRYSFRLESVPEEGADRALFCHLQIGTASRTGIGTGTSYRSARKLAFARAALRFGIGASGKTAGPVVAGRESRFDVPSSILETLETRDDPSLWAPEDSS